MHSVDCQSKSSCGIHSLNSSMAAMRTRIRCEENLSSRLPSLGKRSNSARNRSGGPYTCLNSLH